MKSILVVIALLIVYGSLYPFNFTMTAFSVVSIEALLNFDITKTQLTDLIANIVLFVPFGIFVRAAFPKYKTLIHLLSFAIITFAFAYAIQALQLFTADRKPWGGDAIWNMVGYVFGLLVYSSAHLEILKQFKSININQQISLAIAFTIIALELAPFAPSIDFDVLKDNVKLQINIVADNYFYSFRET
jgi:glycopeptide antibiotics resistance protein